MIKCPRSNCKGTIQDMGFGELKCNLCSRPYPPAEKAELLPKIRNERSDIRTTREGSVK